MTYFAPHNHYEPEMIPGHQNHPERILAMQYLQKLILLHQDKHRIVTVEADSFACMLCGKHGHLADECSEKKKCHRCKLSDHMKEECPAPIQCFRCGKLGHIKQGCSNPKIP